MATANNSQLMEVIAIGIRTKSRPLRFSAPCIPSIPTVQVSMYPKFLFWPVQVSQTSTCQEKVREKAFAEIVAANEAGTAVEKNEQLWPVGCVGWTMGKPCMGTGFYSNLLVWLRMYTHRLKKYSASKIGLKPMVS